jgi:hypothetical protein
VHPLGTHLESGRAGHSAQRLAEALIASVHQSDNGSLQAPGKARPVPGMPDRRNRASESRRAARHSAARPQPYGQPEPTSTRPQRPIGGPRPTQR